jgi:hypothetical protein
LADYPPFMNAYGNVSKILNKIKEAKTPERFSQDYLGTVLGFTGGSSTPFIPLAKRIGLLNPDGTPSELYNRFRNPAQSEQAMADMIRVGYADLYKRNEYVHKLNKADLRGLIMEVTGLDKSATTLVAIASTFEALKSFANFELTAAPTGDSGTNGQSDQASGPESGKQVDHDVDQMRDLRFSHNIYINLPDSKDVEVFNAIFKAMRENLLP